MQSLKIEKGKQETLEVRKRTYNENYWKVRPYTLITIFILTCPEEEKEEKIPDVDDTDGLDPAGEFDPWRLRELGRIKNQEEEGLRHEEEREEVGRRRAAMDK